MIQVLTYKGNEEEFQGNGIKVNKIHDAESLDSFEINIISLQDSDMWVTSASGIGTINPINDLKSLSLMIRNSNKTSIVILLPQNIKYAYCLESGYKTQAENIIALLIINHQRGKAISERERVHEEVIKLAERNGSLIVDTMALLKLFEQYTLKEKSREECIELLENNTGLLEI